MNWSYDGRADALYIRLTEVSTQVASQVVLDEGAVVLDLAQDGSAVGVEVIAPRSGIASSLLRGWVDTERVDFVDAVWRLAHLLPRTWSGAIEPDWVEVANEPMSQFSVDFRPR